MAITDIVTVGGGALTASGMLGRDCAFPITRLTKRLMNDEVLTRMMVFSGFWEDDTSVPVELTQAIDIDTTVVVDACDTAVVDAALTEGALIAPNMRKVKVATKSLQVDELIPAFCKQRNISRSELGLVLNSDGSIDPGNEYAVDFARFALASISKALAQILSQRIMRGDVSQDFGIDGLYTQLSSGWDQGSPVVPQYLNQAVTIDWQDLTGSGGATTPDDLTVASKTINLWGETLDVPVGENLAEFINDFLIPAVENHWTDDEGGVDVWEFHVPSGTKRCMINVAACIQPCGGDSGIWDTTLRERIIDLRARDVVRLFPSQREIPMWESPHVEPNVMWLGPRSIGGAPTYGVVFRDMNQLFNAIGVLGDTYGMGSGYFNAEEPLLTDIRQAVSIPFEATAIHQDIRKVSVDCVQASLMVKLGVLVVARHLWFKITGVTCANFIDTSITSGVTIDGDAIEGTPGIVSLSSPADAAVVADATPDLDWAAVTGATSYRIQIASDALFEDIVQAATVTAPTSIYTATTLTEDATFYWRVRAINANGNGPWSAVRSFTVNAA